MEAPDLPTTLSDLDGSESEHATHARATRTLRPRAAPISLTPLIGREKELSALDNLLVDANHRLVTITGAGGIGKTRLVLDWLQRDAGLSIPAAWAPLASVREPDLLFDALAASIGLHLRHVDHQLNELIAAIDHRPIRLVLDNMEHLQPAAIHLAEMLTHCPELQIIATSRARLGIPGEAILSVPALKIPETRDPVQDQRKSPAVRLFLDRVLAGKPADALGDHDVISAGNIVRHLDGVPLAIELAAEKALMLGMTPTLDQFDKDMLASLTNPRRSVDERHQTIRSTIAWSVDLLPRAAQAAFRRVAIFTGSFTLDAGAFVATGADEIVYTRNDCPALDDIVLLIEHHLLVKQRDNPLRLRMLQVVREFGLESLQQHDETEIAKALHAAWFERAARGLQQRPGANRLEEHQVILDSIAFVEDEWPNLLQAFRYHEETGAFDTLLLLPTVMFYCAWFRGHLAEVFRMYDRALSHAPFAVTHLRCRAAMWGGLLAAVLGRESVAIAWVEESLEIVRQLNDPRLLGVALKTRGQVAAYFDKNEDAVAWYVQALESIPDCRTTRIELSLAYLALGQPNLVRAANQQPLDDVERDSIALFVPQAQFVSAALALSEGDAAEARRALSLALDGSIELNDPSLVAESIMCIAGLAVERRDYRASARLLATADAIRETTTRYRYRNESLYRGLVEETEASLPEQALTQELRTGSELSIDEALQLARAILRKSRGKTLVLTPRELEILQLMAAGLTDPEIANRLFISRSTVSNHATAILRKLDVHSRASAVAAAHALSLLQWRRRWLP